MIRTLAALLALGGTQAVALSCLPADPIREYQEAQASPNTFHVLFGHVTFDASQMSGGLSEDPEPEPAPVRAQFDGNSLASDGFTRPLVTEITLQPTCAGPYCGSVAPGFLLLFARVTDGGYIVEVGPCGGGAYDEMNQQTILDLYACAAGESCGE